MSDDKPNTSDESSETIEDQSSASSLYETLPNRITDTQELNLDNLLKRLRQSPGSTEVLTLDEQQELVLLIRGMTERFTLTKDFSVILGRADPNYTPDVDLTAYGGRNYGVSRRHARLYVEGKYLFVIDLGSTNGVYLSGERLQPNKPIMLLKNERLALGLLPIQIMIR
jgi:hypothetical protein